MNPSFVVREARSHDLSAIVRVHQAAFPGFLMTMLGPAFLRRYYQTVLDYPGNVFLVAVDSQAAVLGFVAGFCRPADFYRLFRKRKRGVMLAAALHVAIRPILWGRVIENMRRVETKSREGSMNDAVSVELASIGVVPRSGRRGVGKSLVNEFLARSVEHSASVVDLTTDAAENESVNRFYQDVGFALTGTSHRSGGRRMNHYEYRIGL